MPRQLILVRRSDPRTAGSRWMLQSSILAGKGWKPDLKASLLPPANLRRSALDMMQVQGREWALLERMVVVAAVAVAVGCETKETCQQQY